MDVGTEVTVLQPHCAVIPPGARDITALIRHPLCRSEAAVDGRKSSLHLCRRTGGKHKSRRIASKLAVVEVCGGAAEDKVDASLDAAALEDHGPGSPGQVLTGAEKPVLFVLPFRERGKKQGVLVACQNAVLQFDVLSVQVQGKSLSHLLPRPRGVGKAAALEPDIVRKDLNRSGAEGVIGPAVLVDVPCIQISGVVFSGKCDSAL